MTRLRVSELIFFGINIVFITIAFLFIEWLQAYASGDISAVFSFEALANIWNWIVIISQAVLATYIVNFIMSQGYSMRKKRASSGLCKVLKTNEIKVGIIYSQKKHKELDEAVEKLNEKAIRDCYVRHAKKLNTHIEWEDLNELFSAEERDTAIKEFKKKFYCPDKSEKRFNKIVMKMISGKYRDYTTLTANELLNRGTLEGSSESIGLKDRRREVKAWLLAQKTITSILFGAALSIIVNELIIEFTLVATVANLIYIFFAVTSGVYALINYCNYVERLFDKRNGILERELGIKDEWTPPAPPTKEDDEET